MAAGNVISQAGRVLLGAGLSRTAAAGILGNAKQESSFNPGSVGDGGGGLWGFTSGAESLGALQDFARSRGVNWQNPAIQAHFLLQNLSAGDKQALNSQPSARAAAAWFMNNWEKPYAPTANLGRRQAGAVQAFRMLGGNGATAVPGQLSRGSGGLTMSTPGQTVRSTNFSFNKGGYDKAMAKAVAGQYIAQSETAAGDPYAPQQATSTTNPLSGVTGENDPLIASGVLNDSGNLPNAQNYVKAQTALQHIAGTDVTVQAHQGAGLLGAARARGQALVGAANTGEPPGRGLAKVVSLALRATQLESQFHDYTYSQAPGQRTNEGRGPLQGHSITFDCSGFVDALYRAAGLRDPSGNTGFTGTVESPSGPAGQLLDPSRMQHISEAQARPGDIVLFPDHVTVYVGNGQVVSMGQNGDPIRVSIAAEAAAHGVGGGYFIHMRGAV